jgi:predicted Zn-dependent protease
VEAAVAAAQDALGRRASELARGAAQAQAQATEAGEENRGGERRGPEEPGGEGSSTTASSAAAIAAEILRHCSGSLASSIYRVSVVVSDDAYHQFVHEHCEAYQLKKQEEDKENKGAGEDGEDDDEASDDDDDDDDDEEEAEERFDQDELVDREAEAMLERIQQQVLDRARQIQSLRSSVIRQATQVALSSSHGSKPTAAPAEAVPADALSSEQADELQREAVALQESLLCLRRQYDDANERLMRQLKELEATAEVIAKSQAGNPARRIDELMRRDFAAPPGAGRRGGDEPVPEPDVRLEAFLRG